MMSDTTTSSNRVSRTTGVKRPLKKSEQTREAILTSALEFLSAQPFRELTVATLMDRAGASRPTFYQYFRDLYDLMGILLEGLRKDIFTAASPWFEGKGDPVPHLKEALTGLVNVCYDQGPILRAVSDAAVSDATLEKAWSSFLKSFDDAVATRIEQHQAQGLIKAFPAYPIAVALNRLDASLLIVHFGRRPRGNREAVLATLMRIWCSTLYGISGNP